MKKVKPYLSVNHQENVPEHVVDEMNRLGITDRGVEIGIKEDHCECTDDPD